MNPKVRVAVVGAGGIGGTHLRAYTQTGRAEIVAVADPVLEAAQARAEEYNCRAYADYRAMLEAEELRAISVCTPPMAHQEITEAALNRGLAVLCEKPLARTVAEARAMVETAERTRTLLLTGLCHRFHPAVRKLKEMITAGQLGHIVHFRNRFAFKYKNVESTWFVNPELSGGGVVMDTAVHSVDIFRYLVGEVASVGAHYQTILPGLSVEDDAALFLRSVEGVSGVIECSWVTPVQEWTVTVYGTGGTSIVNYGAACLHYRLEGEENWTVVPDDEPDRFLGEINHFLDCIINGAQPLVSGYEGLRGLEVLAAASRGAQSGCIEPV